jgi:secondary thiamine-phosphate synthase enzyme
MPVHSSTFQIDTNGASDIRDITSNVERVLRDSSIADGLLTVFVPGSTAGITTIEYEPGVVSDFRNAIERLIPHTLHYDHDSRWGDGNGYSHVRAALLGPSLTVPVIEGELQLGTWQQIILVDFDNRARNREIVVQIVGE